MKTVFTNEMCAHTWAQLSQPHGHSSSMKFDGPTIYSYSTAIAHIYAPENLALVNSRTYSKTTSCKHMPAVTRALSIPFVRVPHVSPGSKAEHAANLEHLLAQYEKERTRLHRARYVSDYEYLQRLQNDARLYAAAFMPKTPVGLDWQKDRDTIRSFRTAREVRLNTPANIAKRERAAAKREEYAANARARKEAILREKAAEAIALFRSGDARHRSIYGLQYALLRVVGDVVQTSQGADVDIRDARAACEFILARKAYGYYENENAQQQSIGAFTLREINPTTGIVTIGCHRIELSEVRTLAAALGVAA